MSVIPPAGRRARLADSLFSGPRTQVPPSKVISMSIARFRIAGGVASAAAVTLLALAITGCTKTQTADQALARAYEATGGQREEVAKVAGTVTIDGQPLGDTGAFRTIVIMYDPRKPDASRKAPIYAVCDEEGRFEFTTYGRGDGVPPGSYIALFVQLRMSTWGEMGYNPPDNFKNEYNDPDKNEKNPEFKIDVAMPGKTDYQFDLKLAGKDLVASPGPRSITALK
jgi:hypothetical protein